MLFNLDDFIQQKKIAQGSKGGVYVIVNKNQPEVNLAAKIFFHKLNENESIIEDIAREVNILASLDHPSVLKFIGYSPKDFKSNSYPVIITDYHPNGSLAHLIRLERHDHAPAEWNETRKLINIYGIASAMSYLHSQKILHRDLKPSNVLVDEYLFPKIADFGCSKILSNLRMSTRKSGIKGSPAYMSPEIISGKEYTEAGDVYAFAMIVYEMITLEKPSIASNIPEQFYAVIQGKRPPFKNTILKCYHDLITSCWQQDPKKRPSFEQIVKILRTNPQFTLNVNVDEFNEYIDIIENVNKPIGLNEKFSKIIVSRSLFSLFSGSLSRSLSNRIEIDNSVFSPVFNDLENIQSFKNLHVETQMFFKDSLNDPQAYKNILSISEQNLNFLINNGSFNSDDFISILHYFQTVVIELKQSSPSFEQNFSEISKIAELKAKIIKFDLIVSDLSQINQIIQNKTVPISITIEQPVASIPEYSFFDCSSVTNIKIPQTVSSIESKAFLNCSKLVEVKIPASVKSIGKGAFFGCSSLANVEIPSSITEIGAGAFRGCVSLMNIEIPSSLEIISDFTFLQCQSLTEIIIPSSVKSIGRGAFGGCTQLMKIVVPDTVAEIGACCFGECILLDQIKLPHSLTSLTNAIFTKCESLTEVTIPSSIKCIESAAFSSCSSLKTVVFEDPASVSEIQNAAFLACSSLETIEIPSSVNEIGKNCFDGCIKLKSMKLFWLDKIEDSLFRGCNSMKTVELPQNASKIGISAFEKCSSLESIVIPNNVTTICSNAFNLCSKLGEVYFHDLVSSIDSFAFDKCISLVNLTIPSSVAKIGQGAFRFCLRLKSVFLPESITEISDSLFEGCAALREINIPSSVKKVGKCSFQSCFLLEKVVFAAPLDEIGDFAFYKCTELTEISAPSVQIIGEKCFDECPKLKKKNTPKKHKFKK